MKFGCGFPFAFEVFVRLLAWSRKHENVGVCVRCLAWIMQVSNVTVPKYIKIWIFWILRASTSFSSKETLRSSSNHAVFPGFGMHSWCLRIRNSRCWNFDRNIVERWQDWHDWHDPGANEFPTGGNDRRFERRLGCSFGKILPILFWRVRPYEEISQCGDICFALCGSSCLHGLLGLRFGILWKSLGLWRLGWWLESRAKIYQHYQQVYSSRNGCGGTLPPWEWMCPVICWHHRFGGLDHKLEH